MDAGRYAPSPTGDLHIGNLRTALLAWAWARSTGRKFHLRLEDLDTERVRDPAGQINDLRAIGLDWDGHIVVQSERLSIYEAALENLKERDLVFECFCSRKDIREAASAAHTPPGQYPGTCANLAGGRKEELREQFKVRGTEPAIRLRPSVTQWTATDLLHGEYTGPVDQVVLRRGDGAFAYNLAVVVDDLDMGVDQIVRGDDLLFAAPTQSYLVHELGGSAPKYGHVPLAVGPSGKRLAKRDGGVTLRDFRKQGRGTDEVLQLIGASLGMVNVRSSSDFLHQFAPEKLHTSPWVWSENT